MIPEKDAEVALVLPDVDERRRRAHGVRALLAARAARVDGVVGHGEHALEDAREVAHVEDVVEPARRVDGVWVVFSSNLSPSRLDAVRTGSLKDAATRFAGVGSILFCMNVHNLIVAFVSAFTTSFKSVSVERAGKRPASIWP